MGAARSVNVPGMGMGGEIFQHCVLQDELCNLLDFTVKDCSLSCSGLICYVMHCTLFLVLPREVNQRGERRGCLVANWQSGSIL